MGEGECSHPGESHGDVLKRCIFWICISEGKMLEKYDGPLRQHRQDFTCMNLELRRGRWAGARDAACLQCKLWEWVGWPGRVCRAGRHAQQLTHRCSPRTGR